ncbi:hypothetical protein UNH65_27500 [Chitinophaga sp. 180180018-2]|nr:hypothetical protein [Chitinophaga sp. 212800010-3]
MKLLIRYQTGFPLSVARYVKMHNKPNIAIVLNLYTYEEE